MEQELRSAGTPGLVSDSIFLRGYHVSYGDVSRHLELLDICLFV